MSELANKISMDLSQSNEITNEKITIINNLGKKILDNTCNELEKVITK